MRTLDTARRRAGIAWLCLGVVVEIGWVTLFGGSPGVVTLVLTACMLAAGAVLLLPVSPTARALVAWAASWVLALDLAGAVADRFGLLGRPGTQGVSWGSWPAFVNYTADLTPWFPAPTVAAVAATVAEIALAALLVSGLWARWVRKATAGLLFVYLIAMSTTLGLGSALAYALPILIGGALVASAAPRTRAEAHPGVGHA